MPELPEVETTKRFLSKNIVGKKINSVAVFNKDQLQGNVSDIKGFEIKKVFRIAKQIVVKLSNNLFLLIHLKMTGQLIYSERLIGKKAFFSKKVPLSASKVLPARSTRIVFYFHDNSALFFNDLRKFGWIKIVSENFLNQERARLGIEPFSSDFINENLAQAFSKTSRDIKKVIMDQSVISGVGNIYANEALFRAGVSPFKPADNLKPAEIEKLRKEILYVLKQGIKYKGTSARDDAYVRPDLQKGEYQQRLLVYQKESKACFECGAKIVRKNIAGRGTFFCPQCQVVSDQEKLC